MLRDYDLDGSSNWMLACYKFLMPYMDSSIISRVDVLTGKW